ncbi:DUF721 family protein [Sediminivirga luteola]
MPEDAMEGTERSWSPEDSVLPALALERARRMAAQFGEPDTRSYRRTTRKPPVAVHSSAGAHSRDPALLGGVLNGIVRRSGWKTSLTVGALMGRWGEIVGPQIADHCTPETFDRPTLVLRASSTAWAKELETFVPQIKQRLAEELGPGVVDHIRVLGPHQRSWRKGRLRAPGMRGPRDTYG